MKRLLIVLCVMSAISITQYVNAKECATIMEYGNAEFSTQNDWERIGIIKCYYSKDIFENGELYVKVISGKLFYKVKIWGTEYPVSKNPQYNPNGSQWYQKYTHTAGVIGKYYFSL